MLHMTARVRLSTSTVCAHEAHFAGKAGMTRQLLHGAFGYLVMGVYYLTRLQTFVGGSLPRFPVSSFGQKLHACPVPAHHVPQTWQAASQFNGSDAFTSCHVAPF